VKFVGSAACLSDEEARYSYPTLDKHAATRLFHHASHRVVAMAPDELLLIIGYALTFSCFERRFS